MRSIHHQRGCFITKVTAKATFHYKSNRKSNAFAQSNKILLLLLPKTSHHHLLPNHHPLGHPKVKLCNPPACHTHQKKSRNGLWPLQPHRRFPPYVGQGTSESYGPPRKQWEICLLTLHPGSAYFCARSIRICSKPPKAIRHPCLAYLVGPG